jgi:hypothetical protein
MMSTRAVLWVTFLLAIAVLAAVGGSVRQPARAATSAWVRPESSWTCPVTHPIKRAVARYSGEMCTYHVPDERSYLKTKPDRCYASESDALRGGCRRAAR